MLKCQLCNFETDNQLKLSKHTSFKHKLKFPDYLVKVKYKGKPPLCQCGCKGKVNYNPKDGDFFRFLSGHQSRLEGHWGDWNNPKRVEKIKQTRKQKFASGEYEHIREQVSKPRSKIIKNKISKSAKGIPKSKPKNFGIGRKHSKKTKEKMSESAMKRIIKGGKVKRSLLEIKFENFFNILDIKFIDSYYINTKTNKFIFDFYLPDFKTFVEIDGDFWHCNPKKFPKLECSTQEINIKNDKLKNKWAKDNNFKLIRFWEDDINNNPQQILESLQKEIN